MANFETLKDEKKQNQSAANAGENLIPPILPEEQLGGIVIQKGAVSLKICYVK